jgi:hypothetical protein
MRTIPAANRGKAQAKSRPLKVGDRVTFTGNVLRFVSGDQTSLLILVDGSGAKVGIRSHWFDRGDKMRGGDPITMAATVTRVADGPYSGFTPVSVEVDGYTVARVTLAAKWLSRAE